MLFCRSAGDADRPRCMIVGSIARNATHSRESRHSRELKLSREHRLSCLCLSYWKSRFSNREKREEGRAWRPAAPTCPWKSRFYNREGKRREETEVGGQRSAEEAGCRRPESARPALNPGNFPGINFSLVFPSKAIHDGLTASHAMAMDEVCPSGRPLYPNQSLCV